MAELPNRTPPKCSGCGETKYMFIETQTPEIIIWRCKQDLVQTKEYTQYAKDLSIAKGWRTGLGIAASVFGFIAIGVGVATGDTRSLEALKKAFKNF